MNLDVLENRLESSNTLKKQVLQNACDQLNKDAKLANCSLKIELVPNNIEEFVDIVHQSVQGHQDTNQNWENLNYRLDLCEAKIPTDMYGREYAEQIVHRVLLKVWFRFKLGGGI